jgi:predicted  nucleic acid-binding Zn-ribbon protein
MGRYCLLWCLVLAPELTAPRAAAASQGPDLPQENPLSVLYRQDQSLQPSEDMERHMATVSILMALAALGVAVAALVWCQKLAENATRLPTNIADADARERLAALAGELPSLHARVDHLRQCWQADTGKLESIVRQLEERTAGLEQRFAALAGISENLDDLRGFRRDVESALPQLESRIVVLEQSCSGLATVPKDLDSLRDSCSTVESVLRQLEDRIVTLEQGYGSLGTLSKDLDSLRAFRDHVEHIHAGIQKAFNGYLAGPSSVLRRDDKTA